ncbi:MAG: HAD family phosphatase [Clostridiales bacterium]|nr:HAD family phosphatase [Clostridiales bacterium]
MVKAVIFDLDGSLVDSMWIWHAIDIEYLGKFGIAMPKMLQKEIGGKSFSETAVYFKERFQLPDTLQQIKDDWNRMAWDKYTHQAPIKNGVREVLEYCHAHHILMGIATSNSRELVDNIVSVHRLEQYISCIVTGCEVPKGKPAPDVYLAVAQKLGVLPEECLVFEDIVDGIIAGKSAGMKVCAVYDKHSEDQDEEKRRLADYYTYEFKELIAENGIFAAS